MDCPAQGGRNHQQRTVRRSPLPLLPSTLVTCCEAQYYDPPPLASCYKMQTNDRNGPLAGGRRGSEVQGPPFPPRRGPVGVGAHLHLHEGDGELVAFPVVPVDPLGRRKVSTSDRSGCGRVPSEARARPLPGSFLSARRLGLCGAGWVTPAARSLCLASGLARTGGWSWISEPSSTGVVCRG